jgi:hypothetical protein
MRQRRKDTKLPAIGFSAARLLFDQGQSGSKQIAM